MSIVFAENKKRDIFLGSDNKLVFNSGLAATLQACQAAVEIQLGEAIYSQQNGVPNKVTAWEGTPNIQQFEFYTRKQILNVENVLDIEEFVSDQAGDILKYSATIKTIYGTGTING
jgi:hypothetical protein